MSTAFQDAIITFKNVWRGTVKLLLEQTSKERIAHLSWMVVMCHEWWWFKQREASRSSWHNTTHRAWWSAGHTEPAIGFQGKHICLTSTLENSSKNCLGPRKEVGMTPERGRRAEKKAGGWQANGARQRAEWCWRLAEQLAAQTRQCGQGRLRGSVRHCSGLTPLHGQLKETSSFSSALQKRSLSILLGTQFCRHLSFGLSWTLDMGPPQKFQGHLKKCISNFNFNGNCLGVLSELFKALKSKGISPSDVPYFIFHSDRVLLWQGLEVRISGDSGCVEVSVAEKTSPLLFIARRTFHQSDPETSWILEMPPRML